MYKKEITVKETIFVDPKDLPLLKPGMVFSNSVYGLDTETIIYDGGIDFRNTGYPVKTAQKQGKFLIDTGKGLFRYALTNKRS